MSAETALTQGCEILILEDDGPLRKRLAAHLKHLGAEVTECSTLPEARRLLRAVRFEFALTDLHLPDGNVIELLREGASQYAEHMQAMIQETVSLLGDNVGANSYELTGHELADIIFRRNAPTAKNKNVVFKVSNGFEGISTATKADCFA